jgi:energy-coupling factor transport system ATP-binding protein
MILSFIESTIPLPVSMPGFKLGLSNVAVLVALETQGIAMGLVVALVKVLAAGFIFGSPVMLAYSIGGTVLAFLGMLFVCRVLRLNVVVASMVAALLHNVGQLLVSAFMLQTDVVWLLLPPLAVAGCVLGFFTGIAADAVIKRFLPAGESGGVVRALARGVSNSELAMLDLRVGAHVAFVGANGSGKSTFAYALLATLRSAGKSAGLVFQDADNQIVGETLRDDCAFALECAGEDRARMQAEVERCLAEVGLGGRELELVDALSGGQKQNLAVAGLLAFSPNVLIFDEVTSMMDAPSRQKFANMVASLKAQGYCVITITQLIDEALAADRVAVFAEGEIALCDTPDALLADPARLLELGVKVPSYIGVLSELSNLGINAPACKTAQDFKEAICRLYAQI